MLLLFALLLSKDTIITTLAAPRPAATPAPRTATAPPVTLQITNTSTTPLRNTDVEWSLQTNGATTHKGRTRIPLLTSNKPGRLRLSLRLPDDTAGESFLQLRYYSPSSPPGPSHPASHRTLLANQQLLLQPYRPHLSIAPAGEVTIEDANDTFTIVSPTIRISFDRQTGWLVHYEDRGVNLLDDSPGLRPDFWWPGFNDSASYYAAEAARLHAGSSNNYTLTIDSGWQAATREPHLQLFSNTTSPELIIIRTEYTLPATGSLLHLSYTINANGEMLISQQVEPDTTQPPSRQWPMPCFSMQWPFPPGFDSITAYGPITTDGPITGYRPITTNDPITDYRPLPATATHNPAATQIGLFHDHPLTSAQSGTDARARATRTAIRWWTISDKDGNGFRFIADTPLLNESTLDIPIRPSSPSHIRVNIDRPGQPSPATPQPGTYEYRYMVKPLVASAHH